MPVTDPGSGPRRSSLVLGDAAPDVTLTDTHGTPVRLTQWRGTPVVLVFVPSAFSGTCTDELGELRDNLALFGAAGVRLAVASCDPVPSLRAWGGQEGYTFDLLSDFWPHGSAARAFGVFDEERGRALRGSFLLGADGVIRWAVVNPAGRPRPLEDYRAALTALRS